MPEGEAVLRTKSGTRLATGARRDLFAEVMTTDRAALASRRSAS